MNNNKPWLSGQLVLPEKEILAHYKNSTRTHSSADKKKHVLEAVEATEQILMNLTGTRIHQPEFRKQPVQRIEKTSLIQALKNDFNRS